MLNVRHFIAIYLSAKSKHADLYPTYDNNKGCNQILNTGLPPNSVEFTMEVLVEHEMLTTIEGEKYCVTFVWSFQSSRVYEATSKTKRTASKQVQQLLSVVYRG